MKRIHILSFIILVFVLCLVANDLCASDTPAGAKITVNNGTITIASDGQYTVSYQGKIATFNKVKTFIMFNNDPYFELGDGRIMKWTTLISKESYNLQKIWDKLYFTKQYGDAELESVSLFVIDRTGKLQEIEISKPGNQNVFEEYSVIGNHYIVDYFTRDGKQGYCVLDNRGKTQQCFTW